MKLHFPDLPHTIPPFWLKRVALAFVGVALLLVLLIVVISQFVDEHALKVKLISQVQENSSYTVSSVSEPDVSIFTGVNVAFKDITLTPRNPDDPEIYIPEISFTTTLFSALSETVHWDSMMINRPEIRFRSGDAGQTVVDDGTVYLLAQTFGHIIHDQFSVIGLNIVQGDVITALKDFQLQGTHVNGRYTMQGQTTLNAMPLTFTATVTQTAFDAHIMHPNHTSMKYAGTYEIVEEALVAKGRVHLQTANIYSYLTNPAENNNVLPVSVKGDLEYTSHTFALSSASVMLADTEGKMEGSYSWEMPIPALDYTVALKNMNLATVLPLFDAVGAHVQETKLDNITQTLNISGDMTVDKLLYNKHVMESVALVFYTSPNKIHIEPLKAAIAEEGSLSITGYITETNKGFRFRGRTDVSGDDLKSLLARVETTASQLPETIFNVFSLSSNLFYSKDQLRLSEAKVQVGELALEGGMVTYFEPERPRVEADVVLDDINLDYFRDVWREAKQKESDEVEEVFDTGIERIMDFNWLRTFNPVIDLNIFFDGFRFLEKQGSTFSTSLHVQDGVVHLENIQMQYDKRRILSDITLDVNYQEPLLKFKFRAPEFNTNYFAIPGDEYEPLIIVSPDTPEERWSQAFWDFSWMEGYAAELDIQLGRLIYLDKRYDRFTLQGSLQDNSLTIKTLNFEPKHIGGTATISGTLVGGKVPGFSGGFTFYNIDLANALSLFIKQDKLSGRASINGSISASGIHMRSWIEHADIKMAFIGRGVRAEGINVPGVIDAVRGSRFVPEVVEKVSKALPTDYTDFSVEGVINVNDGILTTPNFQLSTQNATGNMLTEFALMPWTFNVAMRFNYPILDNKTVPYLPIDLEGTPEDYQFIYDTSSLEAYVAKRIVGR